jgi:hypothetical protein
MTLKIVETHEQENGKATFQFNVLSEAEGIKLWLTNYTVKQGDKTVEKWASFGNDGRFIRRNKIIIPVSVIKSAKAKIVASIYVDETDS